MTLPVVALPTDVVVVADQEVKVRGLSRAEALRLQTFNGDLEEAENHILACGAGVTDEEAREWRHNTAADIVGPVIDRICELSGLFEGAQKSG